MPPPFAVQAVPMASVQPGISLLTRASSLLGFRIRFGPGHSSSSSTMLPVPSPFRIEALTGLLRITAKASPVSGTVSPFTWTVRVALVEPAGMVSVVGRTAV
jgi:hypothetical protein